MTEAYKDEMYRLLNGGVDRKPTMKIDDETYTRAICLIENMAGGYLDVSASFREARSIAASLPKPVDPEKEVCREVLRSMPFQSYNFPNDDSPLTWDPLWNTQAALALAAFRAGRQFQRENG